MAHPVEAVPTATRPGPLLRQAGAEPLPGYRLIEPLGSGGFGEVWKCEAPGGLFKAVKFVGADPGAGALAAQERAAIERIKAIRHPFLLTLERVEIIDGVLVLVMELADRSLQSVLLDYQGRGQSGVPRGQLLAWLREAAEALDVINFRHGLQHLDVKPHNLFVVSNHVKVADFGLVHRLPGADVSVSGGGRCGATPLYASPETLQGSLSRHSDQYSLAICYQQLLTGTVPFWSPNPYQLLIQHLSGRPDLSALPPADRPLVARALAKEPEQRFASCMEFIRALVEVEDAAPAVPPTKAFGAATSVAATRLTPPSGRAVQATVPMAEDKGGLRAAPAADSEPVAGTPSPSAGLACPGYRFLACVGRTALGYLWTVQDADGRERLAHYLLDVGCVANEDLARFEALRHPAVPRREVLRVAPAGLVLVTDLGRETLRDRFDRCRADGLPGLPRPTLLNHLASAAEALDELNRVEGLPNLGVNPTQLVVDGDRLLLEDFGLASLLWAAPGRPAASLNPRYSAPELNEPGGGPPADQYSLALIYTEMLTGIYPRSKPPGGKSGMHRRPAASEHGSGLHRRAAPPSGPAGPARVDLDFLPPYDRAAVARALHDDPGQRFPSCAAFVEALRAATPAAFVSEDQLAALPLVIPFACLEGREPPELRVPTADQMADALVAASAGAVEVRGAESARYIVHPDGAWEYRFPVRIFAGLLKLKLEGFRQQWGARPVGDPAGGYAYEIVSGPGKGGRFWERKSRPAGLSVRLRFGPADAPETSQREALVRVGLFGDHGAGGESLLPSAAPRIFRSLRAYLQGGAEQRLRERWPFEQLVGFYPILPGLEIGKEVEGRGRDISVGGLRVLLSAEPPGAFAYLHFRETPAVAPFAVLGRIVRVQPRGGGFEVGLRYAGDGATGA